MTTLRLLAILALTPFATLTAADAPMAFDHATFTEVSGDVRTVTPATGATVSAKVGDKFAVPEIVKASRKSHAQLTGEDGTIVRVSSNAVFSLTKSTRTIMLEQGSVLFHSPTGKGGGTILSNSITCSVIGTTITVTRAPNGDVTIRVLEGTARVTLANGVTAIIQGGSGTTIPAGSSGPITVAKIPTDQLAHSDLIDGFTSILPSKGKILAVANARDGSQNSPTVKPIDVSILSPNGEGQVN